MRYLFLLIALLSFAVKAQEVSPIPPSGMTAFVAYINKNINVINSTSKVGEIEIEFRVNEHGVLDSFNIVKDIDNVAALALVKLVKQAGDWSPAVVNGVKSAQWVSFPYTLVISSEAAPVEGIDVFKSKFLQKFRYPEKAIAAGVQGSFTLSFEVKENGKLTSIKLLNDPGYGVEEAAIRALNQAGKWNSAKVDGQSINSKVVFEFNLSLKQFRTHI